MTHHCTVESLCGLDSQALCSLLGCDTETASNAMHIIANLMYFYQACLTRASAADGSATSHTSAAMVRFSLPFTDPLFGLVCGLGGVLTMPIAQIHSYLLTPGLLPIGMLVVTMSSGEHTRQMTGSSIQRFWTRRSDALRASIERLRALAASPEYSPLVGKDLLLMDDSTMATLGITAAVHELFDFFFEYGLSLSLVVFLLTDFQSIFFAIETRLSK